MDVSKPGGLDNFDIYVDTEGYAVPSRLVRRDQDLSKSAEEKDISVDVEDSVSKIFYFISIVHPVSTIFCQQSCVCVNNLISLSVW